MSRWVDFRELKQSIGIEQVLASYHVKLKHVGHNQLRGPCPLPTHGSERSGQSFSVELQRRCGPVIRTPAVRYASGEWAATF